MLGPFHLPFVHFSPFISAVTTAYANWRIGPTKNELHSYNKTEKVLLTFDDFADEGRVKGILQVLKNEQVKAIFFLIGDQVYKNPSVVEQIRKEGHWIGNHTKSHKNLLSLQDEDIRKEIIGGPQSSLLRPPFGKYNKRIRNIAKGLGYKICYWNIDSDDWKGINKEEIISRVMPKVCKGSSILFHLNGEHTLEALPSLIQQIRSQGFTLCDNKEDIDL